MLKGKSEVEDNGIGSTSRDGLTLDDRRPGGSHRVDGGSGGDGGSSGNSNDGGSHDVDEVERVVVERERGTGDVEYKCDLERSFIC